MFPDAHAAKGFSCGRTKATYLISDGLGKVWHDELVAILRNQPFALLIDESNKTHGKKYLNILVRYFDASQQKPVTEFFRSVVVNKGKAENIVAAINSCLVDDEIPWSNIIQIMSDSPNVMRGQKSGVLAQIRNKYAPDMVDIGGCSLHYISNAVSHASEALGEDIESFCVDIFSFFKHRTGLCEEYNDAQVMLEIPEHKILRFVSTRWVSLLPVSERLVEQWEALKVFFTQLKASHPDVCKQERTKRIAAALKNCTLVKLQFLTSVLPRLQRYEKMFQSEFPQIHILFDEMEQLFKDILAMFVKQEILQGAERVDDLLKIDFSERKNQLEDQQLFLGKQTGETLRSLKELDKKCFFMDVRNFYKAICQKLLKYLPLKNKLLADLQVLHPSSKECEGSEEAFSRLSDALEPFTKVQRDIALLEWRQYVIDSDTTPSSDVAIHWTNVSKSTRRDGSLRYGNISKVIQCALSLAHGNAATERSFSQITDLLTKKRNALGIDTINGMMTIKSHLSRINQRSSDMAISPEMIEAARLARQRHLLRKTAEKEEEQKLKQKNEKEQKMRAFLEQMNSSKEIDVKEASLNADQNESANLKKKAKELAKQVSECLSQASKLDRKTGKKQKEINALKDNSILKHMKRGFQGHASSRDEPAVKKIKCSCESEVTKPPSTPTYAALSEQLDSSRVIDYIRGDGNCFFRALGKSVYGTELVHEQLRQSTVRHIEQNKDHYGMYIDGDVDSHIKDMSKSGKWATQAEVFAASTSLNAEVLLFIPCKGIYKWHRFLPASFADKSTQHCQITLCNSNGNHYDRVCLKSGKCNCTSEKPCADLESI